MNKTMLQICMACTLVLVMAGSGLADNFRLNMAGASAQGKFWQSVAPEFLEDQGCDSTQGAEFDDENWIFRGTNCDITAADADTIDVAYRKRASYLGCVSAPSCVEIEMVNATSCDFDAGTCASLEAQPVHIGLADVRCDAISQSTLGFEDGYDADNGQDDDRRCSEQGFSFFPPAKDSVAGQPADYCQDYVKAGCVYQKAGDECDAIAYGPYWHPDCNLSALTFKTPIVVPFAFVVNDSVKAYQCTAPTLDNDEMATVTLGNLCEPDGNGQSEDCRAYADCLGSTCANGVDGVNGDGSCEDNQDCKVDLADTSCELQPLENVSRLMATAIFSDSVDQWTDFGPYFDVVAGHTGTLLPGTRISEADMLSQERIIKCMRHAGSGTHSTLEKAVMNPDWGAGLASTDNCIDVFHYRSSSDLGGDCIDRFPGAIGYLDADKILGKDYENTHNVKYNGVEATRKNIRNGQYTFLAFQNMFWDATGCSDLANSPDLLGLAENMAAFPTAANIDGLGRAAGYWASQAEMVIDKTNDDAYPKHGSDDLNPQF